MNILEFCKKDFWLTNCLSFDCYSLEEIDSDADFCEIQEPSIFISAKVESSDNALAETLQAHGFVEINTQVTMVKTIKALNYDENKYQDSAVKTGSTIRKISSLSNAEHFATLFRYDRFNEDIRLPRAWSAKIKLNWILDGNDSRHKKFIVAEDSGAPVGFILYCGIEIVQIELVAVASSHRGFGIADTMLSELERIARLEGVKELAVGTQSTNTASIRAYTRAGFVNTSSKRVFHYFRSEV
mgnify:CR=1 FL=1